MAKEKPFEKQFNGVLGDLKIRRDKDSINQSLADQIFDLVFQYPDSYVCTIAHTFEDLREAYRLVHQEYLNRGYCESNPSQMHYTYYCVLPKSRTILLLEKGEKKILGTGSLILDSPCGFPAEPLFPEELRQIRGEGRRLAEVTLLAISTQAFGKKVFSLTNLQKLIATFRLFKALFTYARSQGVTDLIIAVNPRHEKLYQSLTFKPMGPVRPYSGVRNNPALLMHLDIIEFMDIKLRNRMIQKYFLEGSNIHELMRNSYHWDPIVLQNLFSEAQPLPANLFLIFQIYLKACRSNLTDMEYCDDHRTN